MTVPIIRHGSGLCNNKAARGIHKERMATPPSGTRPELLVNTQACAPPGSESGRGNS